MNWNDLPRFPLLEGPTPLQRMQRLEAVLGTGPLYIKRDDLTPLGLGGNKVRKLEYLVADALAQGCDTLVTVGGVQTNHGRLTAAAAARAGMNCTLVLEGAEPQSISGNILLDTLLCAQLVYTADAPLADVVQQTLCALQERGAKPYFIPEGGSNALGSVGYVQMVPELLEQCANMGASPQRVVCAAGSLGTYCGLWVGARLHNAPFGVTGVAVNPTTGSTPQRAAQLINAIGEAYAPGITAQPDDVDIVYKTYAGDGYNVPDAQTRAAVALLARTEGIFLDPCYTGKAFRGFCTLARNTAGACVFVHTGGAPALWTAEHLKGFAEDFAAQPQG